MKLSDRRSSSSLGGARNTPESTSSGFFAGMSAAVITGHCYRNYWQIRDDTPIAEDAIAMFGVRDLSPQAERERLQNSAIRVVEWRDGRPERDVLGTLEELLRGVRDVDLHIDLDSVRRSVKQEPGPARESVRLKLLASRASRVGGLRARAGT